MSTSILTSTKKMLGIAEDYTAYDVDILMHINSVFATLNQLGIGPENGYEIEDAVPTWDAFIGNNPRYNSVKSYVYLKVRQMFDPPSTSYHTTAMDAQIKELEWRLSTYRESYAWVDPEPEDVEDLTSIIDGGSP